MIRFRTNLDLGKNEKWPNLDHVPPIGSLVYSSRGIETKVESITYSVNKDYPHVTDVDVWIGLPFHYESVTDWENTMRVVLKYSPGMV